MMSALQIFIALFGLAALGVTVWGIYAIVTSRHLRQKPLWLIGCLFAFAGFTINWSTPGDLYGWFGVQIPFFNFYKLVGSESWIAKIGVPIVAIVALVKAHRLKRETQQDGMV